MRKWRASGEIAAISACRILMRLGEGEVETKRKLVMQAAGIEGFRSIAVKTDTAVLKLVAAPIIADDGGVAITL